MAKIKQIYELPTNHGEKTLWDMNDIMVPAYMVTMIAEVDATAIENLRQNISQRRGARPSFTALVMKAAAIVMKKHPEANRAILGFRFFRKLFQFENTDIGVAVEKQLPNLPGCPFASPIKGTGEKSLLEITSELHAFANCDETNNENYRSYMKILKYVPRPFSLWMINAPYYFASLWVKYRGCACWVNAPSKSGADLVFTTWPWPVTFSFGIVRNRPVVVGNKIEVRPTMPIVMVFDRRVMGGGHAGRVFADFKQILEQALFDENTIVSAKTPEAELPRV